MFACSDATDDAASNSPSAPATATPPPTIGNTALAPSPGTSTPIRIRFGGTTITGTLNDMSTARDLASRLPLTLPFRDHSGKEKNASLPERLTVEGVPSGADPEPGDIGYWAPDGDLVLYYGDVDYWNGIVRIGTFDGGRDEIQSSADGVRVTIERAE
jgi:hypothetical protein